MHLRILHYFRVGLRMTIAQLHTHTMQQTRMHKSVTGRIDVKQIVSRQRQSEYTPHTHSTEWTKIEVKKIL